MDFRNVVDAQIQKDGYVFSFLMPVGCTYKSAREAALEIAANLETAAKQAETQQTPAEEPIKDEDGKKD